MKKIGLFIIAGMVGLSSCSESFLNLSPETSITGNTFYVTAEHFDQALIGSYAKIRDIALNGMIMDEMRSDNTFYTMYSGDRGPYMSTEVIALFLDDKATHLWIPNRYKEVYAGIARVNTVLDKMDGSSMTEAEKTKVKAEALFLRAFYYFDLVQHWGGVPLVLKSVTNEAEAFTAKSTAEEVYAQINADVTEAINIGLPIPSTFPQSGRATMGAAKVLRAYVNMSKPTRDYAAAEKDLIDVTKMNYGLMSDYADAFDPAKKNQKESIFEVQYIEDGASDQYSTIPWRMIPKCSNNDFLMGIAGSNYANTSGGWCVPTDEMIKSYEAGDKRLSASVAVAEGIADASEQFMCSEVKEVVGYTPAAGKDFRYFVKKYYHPPYSFSLRAGDNFPIYRYGGALLLLAECLTEQGKNAEALPYVNQVRARAGLNPLATVTKDIVANEMRHELAFESHRWTDLVRTGKAIEVMNAHGKEMKKLYPWIHPAAYNVTAEKLVYAFPKREMDVNIQLVQNPGYE